MKRQRNEKGFTIIEVMIVLAIAGFIMGIVFIAIPALQRNSRNTARQSDASLISAGMGECMTNKNSQTNACTQSVVANFIDSAKLKQLTTTFAMAAGPASATATFTIPTTTVSTSQATIITGAKCNDTTDNVIYASSREYGVLYQVETQSGTAYRCIGS